MDEKDMRWAVRWAQVLQKVRECADGPPSGSVALTQQECDDLKRGLQLLSAASKEAGDGS